MRSFIILAALLAAATPAAADAVKIQPTAPTWCGAGYQPDQHDLNKGWVATYFSRTGAGYPYMSAVAKAACDKPNDPARQKEVAQWRQVYHDRVQLTDDEGRQVMAALIAGTIDPAVEAACKKVEGEVNSQSGYDDLARNFSLRKILGCDSGDDNKAQLGWYVDDGADPDEIARTVWTSRTLGFEGDEVKDHKLAMPTTAAGYAMAGHDARKLDRKKVEAELKQRGIDGLAKIVALEYFGVTKGVADRMTAYYRDKAAAEPALKKLLFDAPEAAFAAWQKDAAEWADALADERATMKKVWVTGASGCAATFRKHLREYVAKRKPKTKDDAQRVIGEPIAYRLASALMACEAGDKDNLAAHAIKKVLERAPARRGPRFHAYYATLEAIENMPDYGTSTMRHLPTDPIRRLMNVPGPINFSWAEPLGQIQKLTPKGDGVLVTFKTTRWNEMIWNCVETKRIDRIEPSGQVIYKQNCTPTGKTKPMSSTEKPVVIAKSQAAGLAAGDFVTFVADATDSPGRGAPVLGFTTADQKVVSSIFGLKL